MDTKEQLKKYIEFIKDEHLRNQMSIMNNRGIYESRQLVDSPINCVGEVQQGEYMKWLKQAKKSFFHTIPVQQMIMGVNEQRIVYTHSSEELDSPVFNGYTARQIIAIISELDAETVMLLLSTNLERKEFRTYYNEIKCLISGVNIYGYRNENLEYFDKNIEKSNAIWVDQQSKSIWQLSPYGECIRTINAKELLLMSYRQSLGVILNTINESLNLAFDSDRENSDIDLCLKEDLAEIKNSKTYKKLKRGKISLK